MDEAEAKKAIEEYGRFVKASGLETETVAIGTKVLGILAKVIEDGGTGEINVDTFPFNKDLHEVEGKLDERIEQIRRMRDLMKDAANALVDLVVSKTLGGII